MKLLTPITLLLLKLIAHEKHVMSFTISTATKQFTSLKSSENDTSSNGSTDYLNGLETEWQRDEDNNDENENSDEDNIGTRYSSEYLDDLKTDWDADDANDDESLTQDEMSLLINKEDYINTLQSLLITASSTDRGQFASTEQKAAMEELITKLESSSFTSSATISNPTESSFILGTWELLYSSTQLFRSSPFFMAGRAACQTQEEAERYDWFCDMHRAALAISEIGKVRQIISSNRMISEFEVSVGSVPFISDFTPFRYSGGLPFTINGAIVSSADITSVDDGHAWELFMDTVEIKGSNVPLLRRVLDQGLKLQSRSLGSFLESNVPSYSNPKPVFRTTFLNDKIRISRDQDGKVFVYGKVSENTEPTDYKGVDADLGLLGLLEGLNDNFLKFSI